MKFRWHVDARAEVGAAGAFYNETQPDLAHRFLDNLEDALCRIQRHPHAPSPSTNPIGAHGSAVD